MNEAEQLLKGNIAMQANEAGYANKQSISKHTNIWPGTACVHSIQVLHKVRRFCARSGEWFVCVRPSTPLPLWPRYRRTSVGSDHYGKIFPGPKRGTNPFYLSGKTVCKAIYPLSKRSWLWRNIGARGEWGKWGKRGKVVFFISVKNDADRYDGKWNCEINFNDSLLKNQPAR